MEYICTYTYSLFNNRFEKYHIHIYIIIMAYLFKNYGLKLFTLKNGLYRSNVEKPF